MAIEILTPDEVGELLRLSPNRIVLLARRGEIPFLTIDGRLRFDARDLEDWLRAHRSEVPTGQPRIVNTEG
jgi:excisionase family DNA binding protein